MLTHLRPRSAYDVCAVLALFVAVGTGGAYAANTIGSDDVINDSLLGEDIKQATLKGGDIAPDTIGSTRIIDDTLLTDDIKNATITGSDIESGTIGSPRIADNSLLGSDVKDGTLLTADIGDDTIAGGGLNAEDLATNSVGQSEIQTDGVAATEIANDSIDSGEIVDFSLSNQDISVLFAQVNSDATIANSSGGVTGTKIGTGTYEVDFGRNVSNCAPVATQGEAGLGGAGGAIMGITDRSGNAEAFYVTARTNANALADRAFHLVVVC
jgi:hypothetical protein